jgi:rod shape-determining protein MreD
MTTYLVGLPLLALAAVVQATVLTHLHLLGGTLDLVLLLALSWTLAGEWQGGAMWGLMGGLCLDLLSGGPLGAHALGLVVVAYLASLSEGRFWRSHVLLPLATVLMSTILYHLLYLSTLAATGHAVAWLPSLTQVTLPAVLINTLLMLPVYHLVRWLHNVLHPAPVTIEP